MSTPWARRSSRAWCSWASGSPSAIPLVRSAVYREATPTQRREAHRALAEVTDPAVDADRRAWHLAHAASGPDEQVAGELERSAGRARARGGLAAAAAFLERAAMLTPDPAQRAGRALAAAQAKIQAGAFDAALDLLAMAEAGPLTELQQARIDVLRAQRAFVTNRGRDAPPLLMRAAKRLEPIDADLARATYLDALSAAIFAGLFASPGGGALEVARAASAAPRPRGRTARTGSAPGRLGRELQRGVRGRPCRSCARRWPPSVASMSVDEELHWLWLACVVALYLWDDERWDVLSDRYVELARTAGALSELPLALSMRAYLLLFAGELAAASSLIDEIETVTEATGSNPAPYGALAPRRHAGPAGGGVSPDRCDHQRTRPGEAKASAWRSLSGRTPCSTTAWAATPRRWPPPSVPWSTSRMPDVRYPGVANWSAAELIEAAVRSGMTEAADETFTWISAMTGASGTSWALGLEARSRALLGDDDSAESLYREAIDRLGGTLVRTRARPGPAPLRGVAAPQGSPDRRTRTASRGARDVLRDGSRGVRRPRTS